MRHAALALLAAAVLGGCGSDTDATAGARAFQLVATSLAAQVRGDGPPADPLAVISPAAVAALGQPVIIITLDATGGTGAAIRAGRNDGVETWISFDDRSVSLRDGLLVATRGLGGDLMGAEVPPVSAIAAGRGTTQRRMVRLDGLDRSRSDEFSCTVQSRGSESVAFLGRSYATRRIDESCSGAAGEFVNSYWFQGSLLRQSRQFVTPGIGTLTIRRQFD